MKSLKALVVLLVVAGLVIPAAAMAEDRLSLSGQMRARAFHTDYDTPDGDTQTWANQRLRIAGKIAVAEGVSVTFRTDITEGTNWGDSSNFQNGLDGAIGPIRTNGFGHARSGAQQQWDRAHLDISKGIFHLRAGQQYIGSGGAFAIDTQDSGLALDMVFGPANVKLFGIVDKDGNKNTQDSFLTGVIADLKNDVFAPK
ncbi:MAG: porin, partial [Desulfuromonadales bacterium]